MAHNAFQRTGRPVRQMEDVNTIADDWRVVRQRGLEPVKRSLFRRNLRVVEETIDNFATASAAAAAAAADTAAAADVAPAAAADVAPAAADTAPVAEDIQKITKDMNSITLKKSKIKLDVGMHRTPSGRNVLDVKVPGATTTAATTTTTTATAATTTAEGPRAILVAGPNARGAALQWGGLVFEPETGRALAVPPPAFSAPLPASVVDRDLARGAAEIVPVDDGTVVTLYPFRGTWAIATARGYDVSGFRWSGPRTYASVLHDLLTRKYPAFCERVGLALRGGRLVAPGLPPTHSHTIGFRHHDFHPLRADPERVWAIASADLARAAAGAPVDAVGPPAEALAGLPAQRALTPAEAGELAAFVARAVGKDPGPAPAPSVWALGFLNHHALPVALAAARMGPAPPPLPPGVRAHHYGFILRRGGEAFLYESSLLAWVRRLVYEAAPGAPGEAAGTRTAYNAVHAFLTPQDGPVFAQLFPEEAARYAPLREFVARVVARTVELFRIEATPGAVPEDPADPAALVARVVRDRVCATDPTAARSALAPALEKIVTDHALCPDLAGLYLAALPKESPPP
jgi:hypothetical protein